MRNKTPIIKVLRQIQQNNYNSFFLNATVLGFIIHIREFSLIQFSSFVDIFF